MQPAAALYLVDRLALSGVFFCRTDLVSPWGHWFPEEPSLKMHIVLKGDCFFHAEGVLAVGEGDLVLLTQGRAHGFSSHPKQALRREPIAPAQGEATHVLVCGGVTVATQVGRNLLASLPAVLHIPSRQLGAHRSSIPALVRMLEAEKLDESGASGVSNRLFELIVLHALRTWLQSGARQEGWLEAAADDVIGPVLHAIHSQPERDWSLESLARQAGTSRSSLSARFKRLLGCSPMVYLTTQRMQLSQSWLRAGERTVGQAAEYFGYESEPAFRRAYKRHLGHTPGEAKKT